MNKLQKAFWQFIFVALGFLAPIAIHICGVIYWRNAYCGDIQLIKDNSWIIFLSEITTIVILHRIASLLAANIFIRKQFQQIKYLAIAWWIVSYVIVSLATPNYICPNHSSAIKNRLATGVKECVTRLAMGKTTRFKDVTGFTNEDSSYYLFRQSSDPLLGGNTCFAAKGELNRKSAKNTWFELIYNPKTGVTTKTCGNSKALGCKDGNTWSFD